MKNFNKKERMKISLRLFLVFVSYSIYAEIMMDDFNKFINHCLDGDYIQSQYCPGMEVVNPQVCKGIAVHMLPINDRSKGQQQSFELEKNYDPAKVKESIDEIVRNNNETFCVKYQIEYNAEYEQSLSRLKR